MSSFPRAPERPPATSPSDQRYFDERDLEAELRRTFMICHECRMCVNFCGSFPLLFDAVDRDIEAERALDVEALTDVDMQAVSEACWQCKLCYIKCPYTADEDAYELLDFPRLMAREKAVRAKRDGIPLVDRFLGEPQLLGAMSSGVMAKASNLITKSQLLRKVQEQALGVSAEFNLPTFAEQPFPAWMRKHEAAEGAGKAGKVVLFATCYNNFNTPDVSIAAVRVLERCGYEVVTVPETCCGMPNIDGGDIARCVAKIKHNVSVLLPHVDEGLPVLVPSPTCGLMLKKEWVEYVDTPEVRRVSAAVVDLMEFMDGIRKEPGLPQDDASGLGKVAYHAACHLRAQKIGFPGMKVLKALPDTSVQVVQECSAVDGTWGMKAEHYESGRKYAEKQSKAMADEGHDLCVTDCGLSAQRIQQETGRTAIHPIQALARGIGIEEG